MIVTFLVPSARRTIGGVIALYEFANGLSRRGHEVHLVHVPAIDGHIERLDDLAWFSFDPGVEHHLIESYDAARLPAADFIELTALEFFADRASRDDLAALLTPAAGKPFLFVQAYGIFSRETDHRAFATPMPKVCIAHWLVQAVVDSGVPAEQVHYVQQGLDHGTFRLLRPVSERPMQVAMLYNAHPSKGARFGLAAIDEVHRRIPELQAVVFSNKDVDVELPGCVTFVKLPPRDVLVGDIYNGSRVFVCSSVKEGFGLSSIEAMASGCALVTTENGGSDDYAIDGETALVCEPRDVAGMADRIERLLRDDALHTRIAERGLAEVQRFDWDTSARELEEFLDRYAEQPDDA